MILPNLKDAIHKAWLYRVLAAILDNGELSSSLYFKGGTCAAMLGWLDRFSIDLDFDCVIVKEELNITRQRLESTFKKLGLTFKQESKTAPQYSLKYSAPPRSRNTIKISATLPPVAANKYQQFHLVEIDRIATCQTKETMFANKLVALIDRFEKYKVIAGRDLYDIHHFFMQGFAYNQAIISERRKQNPIIFFQELIDFIEKKITITIIDQDINPLLPNDKFQKIRKILKQEVLMFLNDEIKRINDSTE